jgi:spermidine synthase
MTTMERTGAAVSRHFSILCVLFFLSGFSALAYQTTWQRLLGLFGGSDSISVTIVVGAFLLGLGLGSLLASSFADRLSPNGAVIAFAACELGIAAFAVASKSFFYDLLFIRMATIADSRVIVFLAAFMGLLVPTVLMGLSLPLLAKGVVRRIETASERIGWLYGVNTLGAAVGAFATGFFIIGTVGYEATIYLAAIINLSVGVGALLVGRQFPSAHPASAQGATATSRSTESAAALWFWCLLVFTSGFIIVSLEIIWFRSISIMLKNTAYSFALVLGWFLLGDALGMVAGTRLIERISKPRRVFLWLQGGAVLYAVTALWLMAFVLSWPAASGSVREMIAIFFDAYWDDEPLTFGAVATVLALVAVVVLPSAFLVGVSVPVTQKAVQDDLAAVGRKVAQIQVANIFGNAAGSFVTGLVFLQVLGTVGSLRLLTALGILFAGAAVVEGSRSGFRGRGGYGHAALAVGLLLVLFGFPGGVEFWSRMLPAKPDERVILSEDRTGVVALKYPSPVEAILYLGGKAQSRVPFGPSHMLLGMLGPLVHPNPKSALIVGLGSGGTAYAAGANPAIEHLRVIEILAPMYDVMRDFGSLGGKTGVNGPLQDPRYQREVGDARHSLFVDPERYDFVEADPLSPHDSYSGLLYSVEYFRQIRERLNPGGFCVQWVPMPRIRNSFLAVFPYVVQVGEWMIGSSEPVHFDAEEVLRRLKEPAIRAYVEAAGESTEEIAKLLRSKPVKLWTPAERRSTDVNTDLFPKTEFYLNKTKVDLF